MITTLSYIQLYIYLKLKSYSSSIKRKSKDIIHRIKNKTIIWSIFKDKFEYQAILDSRGG